MNVKFRVTTTTTRGEYVEYVEVDENEIEAYDDELVEYVESFVDAGNGDDDNEAYLSSVVEVLNADGSVARTLRDA